MRKLTLKELKKIVEAELKAAKKPETLKVKQRPWWDVDGVLANQVKWLKALKIKEIMGKRLKQNG